MYVIASTIKSRGNHVDSLDADLDLNLLSQPRPFARDQAGFTRSRDRRSTLSAVIDHPSARHTRSGLISDCPMIHRATAVIRKEERCTIPFAAPRVGDSGRGWKSKPLSPGGDCGSMTATESGCDQSHPSYVWSYDFVHRGTRERSSPRLLTLIDAVARQCLATAVRRRISEAALTEALFESTMVDSVPEHN